jgi:hypothetical protein
VFVETTVDVESTVEDGGYESWFGCGVVDSAAHSVAEAR